MRVLVFSDIHGNLTALEAVLGAAGPVDAYWCLGDIVGYGPDPGACVQKMMELSQVGKDRFICLQGNHDAAAVGQLDMGFFNSEARRSLEWTRRQLSPEAFRFLAELPRRREEGHVTLVHGSPREPLEEYLLTAHVARAAFQALKTPWAFVGHTHQPVVFFNRDGWVQARVPREGETIQLNETQRVILNPGSVGQPRDGDPRAAYAIWDTEKRTWTWRRVAYNVRAVQERMAAAGLPAFHIYRLELGR